MDKLSSICKSESININKGAQKAIVSLSGGDMRKVLNILESSSLSHQKISETEIYTCTGKPSPQQVDEIMQCLLQEDYKTAFKTFTDIKEKESLTLEDLVSDLHQAVMKTDMRNEMKIFLVTRLADIEQRIAIGCSEKLQVASIVGAFIEARS